MAKLWLGKVRALFHFILSLRIDMKKRVYQNFDTPSFCGLFFDKNFAFSLVFYEKMIMLHLNHFVLHL